MTGGSILFYADLFYPKLYQTMAFVGSDLKDGNFFGVGKTNVIQTLDKVNPAIYEPPEKFVGAERKAVPNSPNFLPMGGDPKFFEPELRRLKYHYEPQFVKRNIVVFENWGVQLREKKEQIGWLLVKDAE